LRRHHRGLSYPTLLRISLNKMPTAALLLTLLTAVPAAAAQDLQTEASVERRLGAMGTWLEIEVAAVDRPTALAASEAAVRAIEATETRLSTWRPDSELSRLLRAPVGVPQPLSPALRADLAAAWSWSEATGGAFHPGMMPLVQAWGLREGGRRPTPDALAEALAAAAPEALALTGEGLVRGHPGAGVEEGGFGKGRALDLALEAARTAGATRARIDLGGQVAWLGAPAAALPVAHPVERGRAVLELRLDGGSFATSGNSERGIEVDGERLGHLIDPRTGRPAPDFGSLGVWAPDATAADCLSTGLAVLGPDAALEWAEEHDGIEVLLLHVGADGELRVRASSGLADRILPTRNTR
jgi:thiamine biosynthesis lipoprotein